MRLLDTDVCVDIIRRHPPALAWLASLSEEPGLPGFVVMELVKGCRNKREVALLLQRVAAFPIYWPTEDDCYRALATYSRAYLSHRLGLLDAVIGEGAVGLSAVLCTFNVKHHRANPHLMTEQPYTRS